MFAKPRHYRALNASKMRIDNQLFLLNLLQKEDLSRADLARRSGLTRAAITNLVNELLDDEIIVEVNGPENRNVQGIENRNIEGPENNGHKKLLSLSTERYYAIGLVLTREFCEIGMMDLKGHILSSKILNLSERESADESVRTIASEINSLVHNSKIPNAKTIGLGISAPGPVDRINGRILNPRNFHKWHYFNIISSLRDQLGWECFLEQQAIARTTYEKYFGIGCKYKSFLLLEITDGIGCGIVLNNEIYSGKGGFGSEIGHMSIKLNGLKCSCGNSGCLTQYASIPAILKQSNEKFQSWNHLTDAAYKGDPAACKLLDLEAKYLSSAIISAVNLLEPEVVVLAGEIIYRPEMLLSRINELTRSSLLLRNQQTVSTICTSIGEHQDLLSACTIAMQHFFSFRQS